MARKRMIDPNIWQSEDFNSLSLMGRLLFIGMFSNADDEGRGIANPVFLRSIVFPYDENIKGADIDEIFIEISKTMSVEIYSCDGKRYYQLTNWDKWQKVDKPKPSLFPAPDAATEVFGDSSAKRRELVGEASGNNRRSVGDESRLIRIEKNKNRIEQEKNIKDSCAEQKSSSALAVLNLPLNDNSQYPIDQEQVNKWSELYPAVDIMQELRKMIGWLEANPKKRKTKQGVLRFVTAWLAREQDKGGVLQERGRCASPPPTGRAAVDELLAEMEAIDI